MRWKARRTVYFLSAKRQRLANSWRGRRKVNCPGMRKILRNVTFSAAGAASLAAIAWGAFESARPRLPAAAAATHRGFPRSSTGTARCCAPSPPPDGRWRLADKPRPGRSAIRRDAHRLRGQALLDHQRRRSRWRWCAPPASSPRNGRIVSGGSTLSMQLARLIEPREGRTLGAKLRQIAARHPDRAPALQARDPRAIPDACALWRQPRRRARGLARLFRQGAEAADRLGSCTAGRAAATARKAPARPQLELRGPRATACSHAWSAPACSASARPSAQRSMTFPPCALPCPRLPPMPPDAACATRRPRRATS